MMEESHTPDNLAGCSPIPTRPPTLDAPRPPTAAPPYAPRPLCLERLARIAEQLESRRMESSASLRTLDSSQFRVSRILTLLSAFYIHDLVVLGRYSRREAGSGRSS